MTCARNCEPSVLTRRPPPLPPTPKRPDLAGAVIADDDANEASRLLPMLPPIGSGAKRRPTSGASDASQSSDKPNRVRNAAPPPNRSDHHHRPPERAVSHHRRGRMCLDDFETKTPHRLEPTANMEPRRTLSNRRPRASFDAP